MEPTVEVLARRVVDQLRDHLGAFIRDVDGRFEDPSEASTARADLDFVNADPRRTDLNSLRWWTHRAAHLSLRAADEHLRGVRAILAANELLPLPAMALSRSVYEAVIQTCWLFDAEASTEQRLTRWAGRLLHDTQEPFNALESFPDAVTQDQLPETAEGRALAQKLMTRAGFELLAKQGARSAETQHVSYRGQTSRLTPNVSELGPRFTPDQLSIWTVFSGATHSRGWLVAGLEGSGEVIAASVLMPLLDTGDALAVELGRYVDLNPRGVVARLHTLRGALIRRASSSAGPMWGVDAYRKSSGAPPLPPKRRPHAATD